MELAVDGEFVARLAEFGASVVESEEGKEGDHSSVSLGSGSGRESLRSWSASRTSIWSCVMGVSIWGSGLCQGANFLEVSFKPLLMCPCFPIVNPALYFIVPTTTICVIPLAIALVVFFHQIVQGRFFLNSKHLGDCQEGFVITLVEHKVFDTISLRDIEKPLDTDSRSITLVLHMAGDNNPIGQLRFPAMFAPATLGFMDKNILALEGFIDFAEEFVGIHVLDYIPRWLLSSRVHIEYFRAKNPFKHLSALEGTWFR